MSCMNHIQDTDYPLSLSFPTSSQVNTTTEPQIMPRPIPSTFCPIQHSLIILPFHSMTGSTDINVNQLPKFGQLLYFNRFLVQLPDDGCKTD